MKKTNKKYLKLFLILFIFIFAFNISGCKKKGNDLEGALRQPEKDTTKTVDKDKKLYLIRELDLDEEKITLEELSGDKRILRRKFSLTTRFENKYKEISSWDKFTPGRVVTIEENKEGVALKKVSLSDKVWELSNIRKYVISSEDGVMSIGKEKYDLDDNTPVFSNNNYSSIADIGEEDELRIVGINKKIISIAITTGHGTIELVNTDLFMDSMISIGNTIFTKISEEGMKIEVPEGEYNVTVANNGYGGTKKVTVTRGNIVVMDLNELKGEGPKSASIIFRIGVDNAKILLDNTEVTKDTPISAKYGKHSLKVLADGYNPWERTLYVNSPSAEIILDLSDEKDKKNTENQSNQSNQNNGNRRNVRKTREDKTEDNEDIEKMGDKNKNINKHNRDKIRNNKRSKNIRSIPDKDYIQTLQSTLKDILGKK